MRIHIQNENVSAEINTLGAELVSFKGSDGFEHIWQGDQMCIRDSFNTEVASPGKTDALVREIGRLPPAQAEHILQIVRDLNEKGK